MPIVRYHQEEDNKCLVVHYMKWGLVPSFTKKSEKPDHFRMVVLTCPFVNCFSLLSIYHRDSTIFSMLMVQYAYVIFLFNSFQYLFVSQRMGEHKWCVRLVLPTLEHAFVY